MVFGPRSAQNTLTSKFTTLTSIFCTITPDLDRLRRVYLLHTRFTLSRLPPKVRLHRLVAAQEADDARRLAIHRALGRCGRGHRRSQRI
jgi:hypothetical protein